MSNSMNIKNRFWTLINCIQKSFFISSRFRSVLFNLAGCDVDPSARIAPGSFFGSNKVRLKSNVFINVNGFFDGSEYIYFEEFVRVGPHVKILTGSHTVNPGVLRRSGNSKTMNLPVTIKRGAWIGMGAVILPGVTISEGCVIGAGSVVVHSTESNGLYAGNPAKRIKDLPTES
ncbi:MAG: acyltransferase [Nitrososphaerales archaeon]